MECCIRTCAGAESRASGRRTAGPDWSGERGAEETCLGARLVDDARRFLREHNEVGRSVPILSFAANSNRSWIHAITSKLKSKPLLDIAGGVIEDYEFLWDQYYFSTATL